MSRKMVKIVHPKIKGSALVPESALRHHQRAGWSPADGSGTTTTATPGDYSALKKADLEAEIGRRNADRDPAAHIPTDGTVEDLRNALVADDQR